MTSSESSPAKVAVVAHRGKRMGGGIGELREVLRRCGVHDPLWYEVPKSRRAPKQVRRALRDGAELVFAWGGDGMVQRCADALAGTGVDLAILPAGTANLLAGNLDIPRDIEGAVAVGLHGVRRTLDLGRINEEHFAVMAGAGFDAGMIRDADKGLKERLGRTAYLWSGARQLSRETVRTRVTVDGQSFFDGDAGCVLVGNVGALFGGVTIFHEARPDDGRLELAVVTAHNPWEWARVFARTLWSKPEGSPLVRLTHGQKIRVRFERELPYELDGGDRPATDRLKIDVHRAALTVRVPA